MAYVNEKTLELSIIELLKEQGYEHLTGRQIPRLRSEILLEEDLKQYLYSRYGADGITPSEVESIILRLKMTSGSLYDANKTILTLLSNGFIFNREDRSQKDLYISLIDFETPENNIFKIVNQFEVEGIANQLRIPDGIVFVNGLPACCRLRVQECRKRKCHHPRRIHAAHRQIQKRHPRTLQIQCLCRHQ